MRDPIWLVLAFAAGSLIGATAMAIVDEVQRRKRALDLLRRHDAGDASRVSSEWMKGHVYQAGQRGDDAA